MATRWCARSLVHTLAGTHRHTHWWYPGWHSGRPPLRRGTEISWGAGLGPHLRPGHLAHGIWPLAGAVSAVLGPEVGRCPREGCPAGMPESALHFPPEHRLLVCCLLGWGLGPKPVRGQRWGVCGRGGDSAQAKRGQCGLLQCHTASEGCWSGGRGDLEPQSPEWMWGSPWLMRTALVYSQQHWPSATSWP